MFNSFYYVDPNCLFRPCGFKINCMVYIGTYSSKQLEKHQPNWMCGTTSASPRDEQRVKTSIHEYMAVCQ